MKHLPHIAIGVGVGFIVTTTPTGFLAGCALSIGLSILVMSFQK